MKMLLMQKKNAKKEFKINWNIKADDLVAQINSLSQFSWGMV